MTATVTGRTAVTGGPDDGDSDGPAGPGPSSLGLPANLDLTIPLADLLGLARRAGEARNLGTIDPGIACDLAAAAARDPRTRIGIIITDQDGHAIGYARARKRRPGRHRRRDRDRRTRSGQSRTSHARTARQ
jgi:hypothetical protein